MARFQTLNLLHGIWLGIRLGQEIMPTNNITKFDDDPLTNIQVTERTRFILANLAIRLGRDILQTNIFTKFDDDTMKTTEIIERINALDAARRPPHVFA